MSFPLYDSLAKNIPKKDLTVKQKEDISKKLGTIDDNGRNLVYALIQFSAAADAGTLSSEELPYGGIREKATKGLENVTWNFLDLPQNLRHILYKFIKLHTKNMEEELVRGDQVP